MRYSLILVLSCFIVTTALRGRGDSGRVPSPRSASVAEEDLNAGLASRFPNILITARHSLLCYEF